MRQCGVGMHDEELAAVRIRTRIGHSHRPSLILPLKRLIGKLITRSSYSRTFRLSALTHKAGNRPMKDSLIIKFFAREENEIVHGYRGSLGSKIDHDIPEFRFQDCLILLV